MATITTDTFLDGGVARTAGEVWACNGAKLTIRTDTRWHANAPASMTGTLGNVTVSSTLGGSYTIDGTKVRWIAFTGGSGTVPAIGATVVQGGVSGYLLGVYASITAIPTAPAAAMPATGFLKFRETTGGTFAAGAFTSGITATASSPDVPGWIEVVHDQSATINIPRLGDCTILGTWFTLGTTTGVANQILQAPTHGSTTTYVPGVWIDGEYKTITGVTWSGGVATYTCTGHGFVQQLDGDLTKHVFVNGVVPAGYNFVNGADATIISANTFSIPIAVNPGTYTSGGTANIHEYYEGLLAADMLTTHHGTDVRSKIVLSGTNGTVRIGNNGTTNVGYVPPSGRKVRIPNVLGRQCTTAARGTNAIPNATIATRPEFLTTNAGVINVNYTASDWYFNISQAYSCNIQHSALYDSLILSEVSQPITVFDVGISRTISAANNVLQLISIFNGGKVTDVIFNVLFSANAANSAITSCNNLILTRLTSYQAHATRSAGSSCGSMVFQTCSDIQIYDFRQSGSGLRINVGNQRFTVKGLDHVDRLNSVTTSAVGIYAIFVGSGTSDILIRGVTFGLYGTLANMHPYLGILNPAGARNITLRLCGTLSAPVSGGTANQIGYILLSGGNNVNIKIQQVYLSIVRLSAVSYANSDINCILENAGADAKVCDIAPLNSKIKGLLAINNTTGQASVYGTHFYDTLAGTTGRIVLAMNEPTSETIANVVTTGGAPKFTSTGQLILANVGDAIEFTQDYFALGHTGLGNVVPVILGTNVTYVSNARWGNHDIFYQIDTGSGFGGTWKNLTTANLFAETGITPSTGFKIKLRVVCAVSSTTNAITSIRINTTSTTIAQSSNLYPLDVVSLTLTGLIAGSEVRAYQGSDPATAVLLDGIESSGTSFSFTYSSAVGQTGYIVIFALGYQSIVIPIVYPSTNSSIPVQQTIDRVYVNA